MFNDKAHKTKRKNSRKKQTDFEAKIWSLVRNKKIKGLKFFRQYGIGKYILDFYCPAYRLAIEIDGGQHNEAGQKAYDEIRSKFLRGKNIRVLRFWNNDVSENSEGVYESILQALNNSPVPPLKLRGG